MEIVGTTAMDGLLIQISVAGMVCDVVAVLSHNYIYKTIIFNEVLILQGFLI
jgi:hypothetical protein